MTITAGAPYGHGLNSDREAENLQLPPDFSCLPDRLSSEEQEQLEAAVVWALSISPNGVGIGALLDALLPTVSPLYANHISEANGNADWLGDASVIPASDGATQAFVELSKRQLEQAKELVEPWSVNLALPALEELRVAQYIVACKGVIYCGPKFEQLRIKHPVKERPDEPDFAAAGS